MRKNCALIVDTFAGEGRVELGENFKQEDKLFQFDVLGDWYRQIRELYDAAEEAMAPGAKALGQRFANWRRRKTCETLEGLTIQKAEPLVNGDVMLSLSDGRVLVFKAETEDVHICAVPAGSEDAARQYAESMVSPGYFTEEPSEQELTPEAVARMQSSGAIMGLLAAGGGH